MPRSILAMTQHIPKKFGVCSFYEPSGFWQWAHEAGLRVLTTPNRYSVNGIPALEFGHLRRVKRFPNRFPVCFKPQRVPLGSETRKNRRLRAVTLIWPLRALRLSIGR